LCTEIFNPIKDILAKYDINLFGLDLAAFTPYMLAKEIYNQTKNNSNVRWIGPQDVLDNLSRQSLSLRQYLLYI